MTGWDPRSADRIVSEVAALLAASLDMETTLRATAGSIQRMLGADRATCYVISETEHISAVYTTEPDEAKRKFLERSIGLGPREVPLLRRHLALADSLLVVEDVVRSPSISPGLAKALGCGAFLGVALDTARCRRTSGGRCSAPSSAATRSRAASAPPSATPPARSRASPPSPSRTPACTRRP